MSTVPKKSVDEQSRVALPPPFRQQTVTVEDVSAEEVRIRLVRPRRRRLKLSELLANMAPATQHEETDFGPPVGNEAL